MYKNTNVLKYMRVCVCVFINIYIYIYNIHAYNVNIIFISRLTELIYSVVHLYIYLSKIVFFV